VVKADEIRPVMSSEKADRIVRVFGKFAREYSERMQRALKVMEPTLRRVTRIAYREAGAPYGESDEGLDRWLRDRSPS
jgi:hypothetical protein